MGKLAVLFAGQGAQKTGMGKSLYDSIPAAKEIFERAEKIMPGIAEMCFEGEQEQLNKTINTQPCVFTVDVAAYAALSEFAAPDGAAGFSLGEYAALCCAGALPFEEALRLVISRAQWMQEAADSAGGGMMAVLGKSADEVDALVAQVRGGGLLHAVNYNCPGQTVVAGDEERLAALQAHCKENKIKCMRLPVSGAFHTQAMAGASEKIAQALEGMQIGQLTYPVYANKTAQPYTPADFKQVLAAQTKSPVLFEQSARAMIADGFDTFVEVGPGAALSGFMKRIGGDIKILNINDMESCEKAKQALTV